MKVVHLLLAGASRFDRTCASIDSALGSEIESDTFDLSPPAGSTPAPVPSHGEIFERVRGNDVRLIHVHGSTPPPARLLARLTVPWVSDREVPLPRSFFRRISPPSVVLAAREVPEAVGDEWFIDAPKADRSGPATVGTYVRGKASRNRVEQAFGRIQRFREDVTWTFFDVPPTPEELSALDLWVDPATGDDDYDGMVAEAIACRTPVVASRTVPNTRRLDSGKAGVLTPSGDHNEMTHAVLNALFKEEVRAPLLLHAADIRDRFRPELRRAAVRAIYREIVR